MLGGSGISMLDQRFTNASPLGLMHSLLYFNSTISDNEISLFANVPAPVHTQPQCRCPPTHPVATETTCSDPSGANVVPRVNTNTHQPSLSNDNNLATWWQSQVGVAPVNITLSLGGLRAALTVGIAFRSLQPQSMVLYYSDDDGITFSPRQYYSSDCSRFGLPNNGLLRTASDVNCITSESAPRGLVPSPAPPPLPTSARHMPVQQPC